MNDSTSKPNDWCSKIKQRSLQCAYWTAAWVVTMALATFGPKFIWDSNVVFTVIAILFNFGIGMGLILKHIQWLKVLDELQKKIQLEAMSLALGAGIIGGLTYSLLDITNLISVDAEISFVVMGMSLTYLGGIISGTNRYK